MKSLSRYRGTHKGSKQGGAGVQFSVSILHVILGKPKKVAFISGPATKTLSPSNLVATFFGGTFFRAAKKVIFF